MDLAMKIIGGLILLTFVTVVLLRARDADTVLTGLAKFNQRSFGMFLNAANNQPVQAF